MTLTSMFYLEPMKTYNTEKPFFVFFPVEHIPGAVQTNLESREQQNVPVTDIREIDFEHTLDTSGFELVNYKSAIPYDRFGDFQEVKEDYFREVEDFVGKKLRTTWVHVIDCDIRRRAAEYPQVQFGDTDCQPLQSVHVDYTYGWGLEKALRLKDRLGETRNGRVQELTLWRPLRGPVQDWPLAICDYRTVDQATDAVPVDQVYPHLLAEGISFYYNPAHRWYFTSDMSPEEAWLIKIMDTEARSKGLAENCPHTAFVWHDAPKDVLPRESIEVRVVAFTADEEIR